MNTNIEQEIRNANLAELVNEPRPTASQRKHDLEAAIGTYEDNLIDTIATPKPSDIRHYGIAIHKRNGKVILKSMYFVTEGLAKVEAFEAAHTPNPTTPRFVTLWEINHDGSIRKHVTTYEPYSSHN